MQENGTGTFQFTLTADGGRASSIYAFIDAVEPRANLVQRTNALASRSVFWGTRAVAVDCLVDNTEESFCRSVGRRFCAEQEIMVCAGAIGSPKLLMLSGLGISQRLRQLVIPCKCPLSGVGQNFLGHLPVVMFFESVAGLRACQVTVESSLFTHTSHRSTALSPDLQFHVSGRIDAITPRAFAKDNFLISPITLQPHSVGYVDLISADPRHDPYMQPNFLSAEQDFRALLEGIELARAFVHDSPLRKLLKGELKPGGATDAELVQHNQRNAHHRVASVWHVQDGQRRNGFCG